MLDLEGQECQPFQISISMPGNCEDFIVEGSLLRGEHIRYQTAWHVSMRFFYSPDPPYPMTEELMAVIFENKTIFLTWEQPYNMFNETSFTYNLTATSNGGVIDQRRITLGPLTTPWEEFIFTDLEYCDEVNLTLIQVGDCREQYITTSLPICKE